MTDERGSLLQRHMLLVEALCDAILSKGDCQVLAVIGMHAGKHGQAWPGVDRIAAKAGIHRSTVIRSVDKLEANGYVEVARKRGLANRYQMALASSADATSTRRAHATSDAGGPVASTHMTGSTDATPPVAPTLRDQSRPRYPNSALELSSSNSKERTQAKAPCFSSEDLEQQLQQQQEREEQKRLALIAAQAKQVESIRAEYLATRSTHPEHARMMEDFWPKHLADLIEQAV